MRVVRNRADARWMPSRFRLATFRLFAWLRLCRMPPLEQPGLVLAIDRDQNATDQYVIAAVLGVVTVSYVSAALMLVIPAALAVPIALLITGFVAQFPMYALGTTLTVLGRRFGAPGENHLRIQNIWQLGLVIVSACWLAVSHSWLRFVCRGFLLLVAIEAVAAIAALLLRKRMAEAETRFEVEQ